ncbi:MAG: HAMP domain-containing histidine kinase [Fibrobacteres bacterium]|nr:HAMP domain-containing histidine kinase [Fibrobacterota bacterium]
MSFRAISLILTPIMVTAVIFISGLNFYTGRKLIGHAESQAVHMMSSCANFASGSIEDSVLKKAALLFDVERVTIIDTLSRVIASSSSMLGYYDDFNDLHVDSNIFRSTIKTGIAQHTGIKKIGDEFFQAFYYPFISSGEQLCVVVESNRRFFTIVGDTRKTLKFTTALLWGVMALFFVLIMLFIWRHLKLLKRSEQQKRLSYIGQTASELAHEMKNPLAIIKSSADVLQKRIDPEKKDTVLNFIGSETMRLSRTIDRVLNLAADKPLSKMKFDLYETLTTLTDPMRNKWPEIEFVISESCRIELEADKDAFYQISLNIINNSIDAMNGRGRISVDFSQNNEGVLTFVDNGPGVPAKYRKSLFEPFVTAKGSGTGLGLAIVSSLCVKHGWKIVLNPLESGASFSIRMTEESWRKY